MIRLLFPMIFSGCVVTSDDGFVDETGYLDETRVRYSTDRELTFARGPVQVIGLPGLLRPEGTVTLRNLTSGEEAPVARGSFGDFISTIDAQADDELEIRQEISDELFVALVPIEHDFAGISFPSNFPQTGPLYPLPEGGETEMDLRQTALALPLVLFNTTQPATLEATQSPVGLPAAVGDEICAFQIDIGNGVPGPVLCDVVSDLPAAP